MMTSSGRTLITITLMATLLCSVGFGASRASMGIVTSSLPFSISDTIVEGDGTVLEGESVTASNLPARIELLSGERYVVGIGSRVTVEKNELVLEGGSVRVQEVTAAKTPVSVRNLRFVPVAADADFEVFMDNRASPSRS